MDCTYDLVKLKRNRKGSLMGRFYLDQVKWVSNYDPCATPHRPSKEVQSHDHDSGPVTSTLKMETRIRSKRAIL